MLGTAAAASLLLTSLAGAATADTGSFTDPRDADAPVVDVTNYALSLDSSTVTSTLTLAAFDLTVLQSATIWVNLDTTGDGATDFTMAKGSGGQAAEVRKGEFGDTACQAATSFNASTRSVSMTAPSSCLGDPSFARTKVYISADEGYDFAPTSQRFTSAVLRTGSSAPSEPAPAAIACPGGGVTFTDPADSQPDSDLRSYRLAYDGSTVCTVLTFTAFDRATIQAGTVWATLDTNGDGAADYNLAKGSEGESAVLRKGELGDTVCPAATSFDRVARTLTLSTTAACIGSPANVRLNVYIGFDADSDFAPGTDRYTSAVGPGTASSPAPVPTPSTPAPQPTTAAPSPSTAPPSPTTSPTPADVTPTVSLSPTVVSAGQVVTVTYRGAPGSTMQVLSKTQPATGYSVIASVVLDSNGLGTTTHRPQRNTRIMARTAAGTDSAQPLVQVRSVASFNAQRVSGRSYTFTGRIYPARPDRLVSLYRSGVLAGQARTDSTGIYKLSRSLPAGSASYYVKTGDDTYNLGAISRTLALRS